MLDTLLNATIVIYALALLVSVIALLSTRKALAVAALSVLAAGFVAESAYIILRWAEAGRAPFSNMFESLVLFSWTIVAVYFVLQYRVKLRGLSAAAALLSLTAVVYASAFTESDIRPLVPALQSNWLTFHVITCFFGYAGFAISFLASIAYLVIPLFKKPAPEDTVTALDDVITRTISFGFLFLTIGIITGSVWANSAWGTYWSWDPKETWSLITWFIYAAFLHCRFMRGWSGRRMAWISIIGFASVIFTYFGVNFLLSGLHSYA